MIALVSAALAAPPRFDRLDVLSEAGAPFFADDLWRASADPGVTRLRFAEQIAVVGALGEAQLSLSLAAQTFAVERPLPLGPLRATAGLRTHAFLPDGALLGLAVRGGPVRVGASMLVVSDATWSRPDWTRWRALPALGLGFGPTARSRAPWMEPAHSDQQ
ncbi:MAG: hypothetical protein KC621_06965 [Myxococcales bacterium]|nr:hypothetical protein [Myxococcales bacterium]